MIFLWIIVWLIWGTPGLHMWNAWATSLIICAALYLTGRVRVQVKR